MHHTYVAKSTIGDGNTGRGVFAFEYIESEGVIGEYPVLLTEDSAGELSEHVFDWAGWGALVAGAPCFLQHSNDANVELWWQEMPESGDVYVLMRALRDIEPHDELTLDYGAEWWKERGLEPS